MRVKLNSGLVRSWETQVKQGDSGDLGMGLFSFFWPL